jgi:hypothetical protein
LFSKVWRPRQYIYTIVGVLDNLENRGYEWGGTAPTTTAGWSVSCF